MNDNNANLTRSRLSKCQKIVVAVKVVKVMEETPIVVMVVEEVVVVA